MQASTRRAFQSHQTLGGKRDEARFSIRTANISRYRVPHFIGARCVASQDAATAHSLLHRCRPGCLALILWLRRNEGVREEEKREREREKRICLWQCTRRKPGTGCQVGARVALDGNARNVYPSAPSGPSSASTRLLHNADPERHPAGTGVLLLAMHLICLPCPTAARSHLGSDGRGQLVGIQAA